MPFRRMTLNLLGGKTREDAQSCSTPANPCTLWVTASRTEGVTEENRGKVVAALGKHAHLIEKLGG
jgi:hypothetical protein